MFALLFYTLIVLTDFIDLKDFIQLIQYQPFKSCTRHEFRELIMKKKLLTLLLAVAVSVGTMFANQVWPIIMDETTFATCNSNSAVVADFRPNNQDRFLYIWVETYDSLTTAGLNSMGNTDGYLSLRVTNHQGWAGAGLCLTESGNSWQAAEQLRAAIVANPDNYYLHMAIKSTDNYSHCFYLFNTEATRFVLGNHSVYDGPVYSDFIRDGAWQEFYIPMSTYASALASVTCSAETNIFVMLSEGVLGAMLNLDAVYICDREFTESSQYSITTESSNPEWGATAGDTTVTYMSEVEISATPNYGYHFVRWNDGNTSNPRIVTVHGNGTFTATFAKNVYSITANASHGSISGNNSAEYLDFVTLTVTPDYGYHFTQWSDGLKDNPRIFQITKDTAFTAEFAPDRVGTCGKDLALVWSYDPTNKVLTIGNAGSFTENMQFGVEAPTEMEELVIGNSVTAIGSNAFAGIETLKKVSIGESVKTIGEQAFYNCVNLETIFNYRPTPTNTYSNAFDGVDKFECKLYVLTGSIDMYKAAAVWRDFYYTYAIGAEETTVTTNDVTVEPQDNAATLTWPTSNNAATYTIQITKDGVVFCTLIFNANGQLIGIAFAPSRDGQAHAPAAVMTANGLQFTVTGLNSGTQYGYSVTAKDANDQPVATYSGEFTTTSDGIATGVEEVSSSPQGGDRGRLILRNNQILILRGDKTYTLQGQEVR